MSLINEALKRAKEAQEPPRAGATQSGSLGRFHTVHSHPNTGILPYITLGLVVLLGFVVVWQWMHMRSVRVGATPARVIARENKPPNVKNPASTAAPAPTAPVSQTVAKTAVPAAAPARPVPVPVPPPNSSKPMTPTQPASVAQAAGKPPTAPAVEKAPAAKPLVLKLQAVVTHPTRPSAVINGKSVFVGDHISEFRVTSITTQSVTLMKGGKSTVLTLRE